MPVTSSSAGADKCNKSLCQVTYSMASTTYYEYKYPQVGKTGVDAVHESCPQMVFIMKKEL
jgi:hypothetical protein